MKVLITSDTHGSYGTISDFVIEKGNIDLIIHAGDTTSDAKNIEYETGIECICVRGNNDFFDYSNKDFELIDIDKHRIFLTHGHKENVYKGYQKLLDKARIYGANIVIFGHTHVYLNNNYDDILILNPGSPSLPRDGKPGFLIMDIKEKIEVKRMIL